MGRTVNVERFCGARLMSKADPVTGGEPGRYVEIKGLRGPSADAEAVVIRIPLEVFCDVGRMVGKSVRERYIRATAEMEQVKAIADAVGR